MSVVLHLPTPAQCPEARRSDRTAPREIAVLRIAPDQRLAVDPAVDTSLCVVDGVVYVAFEDDDVVLTAGDRIVIRAYERHRAWNAGDSTARVIVSERGERVPLAA